jgi:hypothetical protein
VQEEPISLSFHWSRGTMACPVLGWARRSEVTAPVGMYTPLPLFQSQPPLESMNFRIP